MTAYLLDLNSLKKCRVSTEQLNALQQHRFYYSSHILYQYFCQIPGSLEFSHCKRVLHNIKDLNAQPITYTPMEFFKASFGLQPLESRDSERVTRIQEMIEKVQILSYSAFKDTYQKKLQSHSLYPFPAHSPLNDIGFKAYRHYLYHEELERSLRNYLKEKYPLGALEQQIKNLRNEFKTDQFISLRKNIISTHSRIDRLAALAYFLGMIKADDYELFCEPDHFRSDYDPEFAERYYFVEAYINKKYQGTLEHFYTLLDALELYMYHPFLEPENYFSDFENFIYLDALDHMLVFLTSRTLWTEKIKDYYPPSFDGKPIEYPEFLANQILHWDNFLANL